jgi:hypothetical protein
LSDRYLLVGNIDQYIFLDEYAIVECSQYYPPRILRTFTMHASLATRDFFMHSIKIFATCPQQLQQEAIAKAC